MTLRRSKYESFINLSRLPLPTSKVILFDSSRSALHLSFNPIRYGEVKRLSVDEKYLNENGKVDISKLEIISYDPFNHGYYVIKEKVGNAFSDGKKLMK